MEQQKEDYWTIDILMALEEQCPTSRESSGTCAGGESDIKKKNRQEEEVKIIEIFSTGEEGKKTLYLCIN